MKLLLEDSENSVVAGRLVKKMAMWNIKESVVSLSLFFFSSVPSLKSCSPKPGSGHWMQTESSSRGSLVLIPNNLVGAAVPSALGPRRNQNYQSRFSPSNQYNRGPKSLGWIIFAIFPCNFFLASDVGKAREVCTRVGQPFWQKVWKGKP